MKKIVLKKITDILKEFQEGIDFTENEGKIIFHNEELVSRILHQSGAKWFIECVEALISSMICSYEENEKGIVLTFESGKNSQGGRVISKKFKNAEIKKQKNELIEEKIENNQQIEKGGENLNHHFIDSDNNSTYSVEKESEEIVVKETYHEPRNKEEKIIEQNKEQREKEEKQKSQFEKSENKPIGGEKSIQSDKNQELLKDKNNKLPNGWIVGGGIISAVVVLIATVGIRLKGKKRK